METYRFNGLILRFFLVFFSAGVESVVRKKCVEPSHLFLSRHRNIWPDPRPFSLSLGPLPSFLLNDRRGTGPICQQCGGRRVREGGGNFQLEMIKAPKKGKGESQKKSEGVFYGIYGRRNPDVHRIIRTIRHYPKFGIIRVTFQKYGHLSDTLQPVL